MDYLLKDFIDETIEYRSNDRINVKTLYADYKIWHRENNIRSILPSRSVFITVIYYNWGRTNNDYYYNVGYKNRKPRMNY